MFLRTYAYVPPLLLTALACTTTGLDCPTNTTLETECSKCVSLTCPDVVPADESSCTSFLSAAQCPACDLACSAGTSAPDGGMDGGLADAAADSGTPCQSNLDCLGIPNALCSDYTCQVFPCRSYADCNLAPAYSACDGVTHACAVTYCSPDGGCPATQECNATSGLCGNVTDIGACSNEYCSDTKSCWCGAACNWGVDLAAGGVASTGTCY